jgi:hypothetical protein
LTYNGITIGVGALFSTLEWSRTVEYDGPTYLGERHHIRCRGWYNPQSMSYITPAVLGRGVQGAGPPAPTFQADNPPATTDQAIRFALSTPQKQLIYNVGGQNVLVSPPFNAPFNQPFPYDADLGPVPIVHSVSPSLGEGKTWWIEFEVSTLINECGAVPPPDVINSHRWLMTHELDVHGLCRRHIQGHVYFRTDRLAAFNLNAQLLLQENNIPVVQPDQFRGWLLHPPFTNSRRENLVVTPNADGDEYTYSFTDVELPINFYAQNVSDLKCRHYCEIDYEGAEGALNRLVHANLFNPNLGDVFDLATVFSAGGDVASLYREYVEKLPLLAKGAAKWAISQAQSFKYNPTNIPAVIIGVTVQVWGNRSSTRKSLENIAWQIGMARLNLSLNGFVAQAALVANLAPNLTKLLGGKYCRLEHDVTGKYVELNMRIRAQSLGAQIVSQLTPALGVAPGSGLTLTMPAVTMAFPYQQQFPPSGGIGIPAGTPLFPDPTSDETQVEVPTSMLPFQQNLNALNIGPQTSAGFANDGGSRGSYLGLAVAQAILNPCQQSPQPTDPPNIDGAPQQNTASNPIKSWSPP